MFCAKDGGHDDHDMDSCLGTCWHHAGADDSHPIRSGALLRHAADDSGSVAAPARRYRWRRCSGDVLVVGSGGGPRISADPPNPYGGPLDIDGLEGRNFSFSRFGYFLMDRDGEDWTGAFRDLSDQVVASCRLHERALSCTAPKTVPPKG